MFASFMCSRIVLAGVSLFVSVMYLAYLIDFRHICFCFYFSGNPSQRCEMIAQDGLTAFVHARARGHADIADLLTAQAASVSHQNS
jgi:hypothetical protein